MLTNRLQIIKENLQSHGSLSPNDRAVLDLINKIDDTERRISTAFQSENKARLLEMIVRPGGSNCTICGRTL